MLNRIGRSLHSIFRRGQIEAEMQEEMAAHLDMAVERMMARGMSDEEARRAALREFGNVSLLQEEAREAWGVRWIESLLADVRFALRTFRRTPFATATIIGILALGLGVNTALFTIVHSVLTLPAPGIEQNDSLVRIRGFMILEDSGPSENDIRTLSFTYPQMQEISARSDLFIGVAGWTRGVAQVVFNVEAAERVEVELQYVTDRFFEVLAVNLPHGTGFPSGDIENPESPTLSAVVDFATWDRLLGQDPGAIGETIRIAGIPFTIAGVAPPLFRGVDGAREGMPVLWVPLATLPQIEEREYDVLSSHDVGVFRMVGTLREGVDLGAIGPALLPTAQEANVARTKPWTGEIGIDAVPLTAINAQVDSRYSGVYVEGAGTATSAGPILLMTGLLLAIVCLNVGALLAALALTRQREIVVRLALGASRPRIIRQLLTESALRTIAGGMVGAAIVWISLPLIDNRFPGISLALAWETILFTFSFALATGVLLGLLPALHATRISVADALKNTAASIAGRRSKLPRIFVISQIALTLPAIAVLSAFLIWGARMWDPATSYDIERQVVLADFLIGDSVATEVMPVLRDRLDATPGVVGSTLRRSGGSRHTLTIHSDDRIGGVTPEAPVEAITTYAGPGYFEVMNLPLVLGRDFLSAERDTAATFSSVILRADVAHRLWGDTNPIGRRLIESDSSGTTIQREFVVVGVVNESQMASASPMRMSFEASEDYIPIFVPATPYMPTDLLIRTEGDAAAMLPTIRARILDEVSAGTLTDLETLAVIRREALMEVLRAVGAMVGTVALGLLLSAIGLYGVISVAGGQRVREIGVRTVMGATPEGVRKLILKEGARLGALGILFGLPPSLGLLYYMASEHVDSPPYWTHIPAALLTAFLVVGVTLLASWLPARRAASVDPMTVLRVE